MKKSQVSIEFAFFVGTTFVLLAIYLLISYNYLNTTLKRKEILSAVDLMEELRNEINLASRVENGYARITTLPSNLNKQDYSIDISDNETRDIGGRGLSINFNGIDYARLLSTKAYFDKNYSSDQPYFKPGDKISISKVNNEVYIGKTCNQGDPNICSESYPGCRSSSTSALSSSTGPNGGTSFSTSGNINWKNWNEIYNAMTSNDLYAFVTLTNDNLPSRTLQAGTFNFNVPSSATITGINVSIEKRDPIADDITDGSILIVKNGVSTGTNHADTLNYWSTTDAYTSYGSSSDLWGTTWTPAEINNAGFGVAISTSLSTSGSTAYIDHIRITVYYTTTQSSSSNGCLLKCENKIWVLDKLCPDSMGCNSKRNCIKNTAWVYNNESTDGFINNWGHPLGGVVEWGNVVSNRLSTEQPYKDKYSFKSSWSINPSLGISFFNGSSWGPTPELYMDTTKYNELQLAIRGNTSNSISVGLLGITGFSIPESAIEFNFTKDKWRIITLPIDSGLYPTITGFYFTSAHGASLPFTFYIDKIKFTRD